MPLIALKCPQCNADLEIDSEREFMYCEYCGTKVMRDSHTQITNNYTNKTVNNVTYADGHAVHTADWYYENWQGLLDRKRWDDADELFEEFKREYPLDYRVEEELKELRRDRIKANLKLYILYPVVFVIGFILFLFFATK